jgi:hypothetical protein
MGLLDAVEEEIEEVFPPKPGGLVDRHRQKMATRHAEEQEALNTAERVEAPSYKAVKVAPDSPEVFAANTVNVPSGGNQMILPASPYRSRATIVTSSPILIGKDASQVTGGNGFPLAANTMLVVSARGQLWAYGGSATVPGAATVNVLAEIYAPEK